MPFSTPIFKQQTLDFLTTKYNSSHTILDLGAGCGTYSDLLRTHFPKIDAVEIHEPYIQDYHLKNKYVNVYNENALTFDFDYYDIIILGDILEHISEENAIKLLDKLCSKCDELIVCVPFNSEQGIHFNNVYEIHLQTTLTNERFLETYKGFRPFALRYDYGIYIKNNKSNKCVKVEYDIYSEKRILSYDDNLNPMFNESKTEKLTVVTGLWNIGRPDRSFDQYIDNFKKILATDVNMFVYVPKEYEHIVWETRKRFNTSVKVYELDDIKNDIYKPHWNNTQKIRIDPDWYNKVGWLKNSPQATLEWYNPLVQSKMFFLHSASIWNPFHSDYFIWLDAGITNTVYEKYFTDNRVLDKILPYLEQFLFLSYPYEANSEIHGFDFDAINRYSGKKVTYVCRGGLFGGTKESINHANATYYSLLDRTLNDGYMGTEESVFTIMSYLEPEKYRRYSLDSNGLVVKFVQALLDNKVELEPVPADANTYTPRKFVNPDKLKLSVYMLTFNFPHQLEHTIQTWLQHPKWITNTRNILIDNSTNEDARIANAQLCKKYKFEHIINNKNDGINGGRLKAAQHFQESDSDYYVFLEDDMGLHPPGHDFCRNGFRTYVPDLYDKVLKIIGGDVDVDFLKFSYSEVYMDNNIQVSWYNVPKVVRAEVWPNYTKLPVSGLDPNCPRTQFDTIEVVDGLSYIKGDVYYANWPMIVGKSGNKKMFLDTTWAYPYEQTWMSYMFQETKKGNLKPAILLASPIHHNRIAYYKPEERKENAG